MDKIKAKSEIKSELKKKGVQNPFVSKKDLEKHLIP
jgi:hypothetical protein